MSKKVYIGVTENGPYLEIVGIRKNGESYRKRTNKEDVIRSYISENANRFMDGVIKGKDLILYTADKRSIVLKNFKELENVSMFNTLFRRIYKAPIVSKNLKNRERTNLFQALQLKILYANKVKLATLALTGSLLVTSVPIFVYGSSNFHNQQSPVTEIIIEQNVNDFAVAEETITVDSSMKDENVVDSTIKTDILNFSSRLEETKALQSNYSEYDNSKIMIGARVNTSKMGSILESNIGTTIIDTAITYGVDPYLLLAKGLAESSLEHDACCPGGARYNGYGVGAFQLESPDGRIVKAWNYKTGNEDALAITMENAVNFTKNGQGAAMYLQNRINLYNGNPYLALQSYNYGVAMMKIVIHDYAKQMGITEEEVMSNINDLGWLQIVEDIHNNPNDYYYRVTIDLDETDPQVIANAKANYVWKHATYGNPHYLADVLSYYVGLKSQNRNLDGTSTVIDFSTNEIKQILDEVGFVKLL